MCGHVSGFHGYAASPQGFPKINTIYLYMYGALYIYISIGTVQIDQVETLTIFFIQVRYRWPQKNSPHQFSDFFENFFGSNGRNFQFGTKSPYRFF